MKNTALLVMDYQIDILKIVESQSATLLKNASALIQAARKSGTPVIYVQVAFRPGYPEVNPRNKGFGAILNSNRMLLGNPNTEIHSDVAPRDGEAVVIKHRVGAMHETDMLPLLRAKNIEHLVLAGISTSGVVLSTLRVAADMDFKITVVSDACADNDPEVHSTLMNKVFPRQAEILTTETVVTSLLKS